MLAGMPQAPSAYSPVLAPSKTKQRRNEVLRKMAELKMITPQKAQATMAKGLDLHMEGYFQRAREHYVLDYIQSELIKEYGVSTVKLGGLRVYTTIDLDKQKQARDAIKAKMGDIGPSSAIVSIDPRNGDILAMASSAAYGKSKFNLAAQGHRQPGSSFKVMALMTALRLGVNPDSTHYVSVSPMTSTTRRAARGRSRPTAARAVATSAGAGHAGLRQRRLRAAHLRSRAGQGQGDRADAGHHVQAQRLLRRIAGRPRGRRLAAGDGRRLRHDRQRRLPQPAADHPQGQLPGRPLGAAEGLAGQAHEGVLGRRDLRGDEDPRGQRGRRHRHARADRLPAGRQDGHHRPQHRRVVRRLHAAHVDGRVGRLSRTRASR